MVFTPNSEYIKAATRLCICEICKLDYGSCPLFKSYELQVGLLKEPLLRSDNIEVSNTIKPASSDFFLSGSVCAVAAESKCSDTVWFIKIIEECLTESNTIVDDYGHQIAIGQSYLIGNYFEKEARSSSKHGQMYKCMKKKVFFYKESVVYPFVNLESRKNNYFITNIDFYYVLSYAEHNGMSAI